VVASDPAEDAGAAPIVGAVQISQADYEALTAPRAGVLYVTTGESSTGIYLGGQRVAGFGTGVPGGGGDPDPAPTYDPADLAPVLWFDFSDESTVTAADDRVVTVQDLGSHGAVLTASTTGPAYVIGINGRMCVDFEDAASDRWLADSSTSGLAILEAYIVLQTGFGSTFPGYSGLITSVNGSQQLTGWPPTAGFYLDSNNSWDRAYVNAGGSNVHNSVLPAINSPSLLRLDRSQGTALAMGNGFQIGRDRTFSARNWTGLIGEMICFTAALSEGDRADLQQHLANKWNLTLS
jgi:hypothetical protein